MLMLIMIFRGVFERTILCLGSLLVALRERRDVDASGATQLEKQLSTL